MCVFLHVWEWEYLICKLSDLSTLYAYVHNVINCHAVSFCQPTSPHACTHTDRRVGLYTPTCTHIHTDSYIHMQTALCILEEKWWKWTVNHTSSQRVWTSLLFSFTYNRTVAVSEPFRLSPANVVDFIYDQGASLGPVVQVKLFICLHSLITDKQLLGKEMP